MEALSLDVLAERMRNLDARTRSNHDALGSTRREQAKRQEAFIRIEAKVDEQAGDITDMKNTMKWIVRGLFGAIAVGLMFVVAVATLILQAAS